MENRNSGLKGARQRFEEFTANLDTKKAQRKGMNEAYLYCARDFLEVFFGRQDFSFDLVEQLAWCFIHFEEMEEEAERKEKEEKDRDLGKEDEEDKKEDEDYKATCRIASFL